MAERPLSIDIRHPLVIRANALVSLTREDGTPQPETPFDPGRGATSLPNLVGGDFGDGVVVAGGRSLVSDPLTPRRVSRAH